MLNLTQQNLDRFDAVIGRIMEAGQAAGLAAAVVNKQGELVFEKYYGLRDVEKGLPIDRDTIFGVASITKSFTSLAIMQLHEAGKLHIDDPISKYIPEYHNKNQGEPVRIWHLMCHSGGFYPQKRLLMETIARELGYSQETDGDFAFIEHLDIYGTSLVATRMAEQEHHIDLPGRAMSYFNDGFALLSHIILQVSGERSFADYIKNHICLPLGMDRSSSEFVAPAADPNASVIYVTEHGPRTTSNNLDNAFVLNGGGAMKSTIADMARYISMYLNYGMGTNGTRVASMGTIREMIKPRQANGYGATYGFGLLQAQADGYSIVYHNGSLPGVSSAMVWSYELDMGAVILCNTEDVAASPAALALLRLAAGQDPEIHLPHYADHAWAPEYLAQICGRYESDEGAGFTILEKEGKPYVDLGKKEAPLLVISDRYAVVRGAFNDVNYEVLCDETRGVYAMRQGSRIVRKIK
ncbi:MAG: serine hydrolase [Clostridia bacterium]|nr:serine hydrolase [Clostridia bacterium]